jgi:hypothetical protein
MALFNLAGWFSRVSEVFLIPRYYCNPWMLCPMRRFTHVEIIGIPMADCFERGLQITWANLAASSLLGGISMGETVM